MKDMYDLNNKNDNDESDVEIETLVGKNAVEKILRRISKDEKSKDNNSFGQLGLTSAGTCASSTPLFGKPLTDLKDVEQLARMVHILWWTLDSIVPEGREPLDEAGYRAFYQYAIKCAESRHALLIDDGFELYLPDKNHHDKQIETYGTSDKFLNRKFKIEEFKDNESFGCCPKKHYDFWIKFKRFFSLKYHRSQKENKRNHKEKGELNKLNVEYATKKDLQKLGRHGNSSSMNYVKTKSGAVVVVPGLNPQAIAKQYKNGIIMEAMIKE